MHITLGAQWSMVNKKFSYDTLPLSDEQCWKYNPLFNGSTIATTTMMPALEDNKPFALYTLSFVYYTLVGTLLVIVIGIIVSCICEPNDLKDVNPDHFAPF